MTPPRPAPFGWLGCQTCRRLPSAAELQSVQRHPSTTAESAQSRTSPTRPPPYIQLHHHRYHPSTHTSSHPSIHLTSSHSSISPPIPLLHLDARLRLDCVTVDLARRPWLSPARFLDHLLSFSSYPFALLVLGSLGPPTFENTVSGLTQETQSTPPPASPSGFRIRDSAHAPFGPTSKNPATLA